MCFFLYNGFGVIAMDYKEIAAKLLKAFEESEYSYGELSRYTGIPKSALQRYITGDTGKIPMDRLRLICEKLDLDTAEVLGWDSLQDGESGNLPPDFEKAATKAAEILVQYRISSAPVLPLQILNSLPGVLVRSFTEFADEAGLDRKELVSMYGSEAQDAVTFSRLINGKQFYIVAYNQRMPFYMLQLSLARELAFIVLGTEDSRHEEPRMSEALCFTRHLLCPRPLISSLMAVGFPLTVESVGSLTGCYGRCLAGIRETPGAQVAAGLNRLIRQQFAPFVENLAAFGSIVTSHDDSPPADFGTFMDDYEE